MKLYATITSERATKGQGGNEFVDVQMLNENKEPFLFAHAIPDGTNNRITIHLPEINFIQTFYIPKGERQKGEYEVEVGSDKDKINRWGFNL